MIDLYYREFGNYESACNDEATTCRGKVWWHPYSLRLQYTTVTKGETDGQTPDRPTALRTAVHLNSNINTKKQRYNCFISNTKYIRFCVFLPLDASLYHSRISHFLFTVHTSPGSHTSHLTSHLHRGCLCRELDQILQYVIKGICSVRISLSLLLIRRRSDIL